MNLREYDRDDRSCFLVVQMTVMIPTFAEESVCPADFMTAKTVAEGKKIFFIRFISQSLSFYGCV